MLVIGLLSVAFLASLYYNHKLYQRLRGYEHVWEQIEQVADRNQDGSFTINIEHLEEHHPEEFTAHSPISSSSIPLLDQDDVVWDDTPTRAA